VLKEDWSLTRAAAAGGISERTAGEWVRRYRAEGELGLVDRSSAPEHVSGRTDEARVELSDAQAAADDRGGDHRASGDGALDRVGDLHPDRAGQALAA